MTLLLFSCIPMTLLALQLPHGPDEPEIGRPARSSGPRHPIGSKRVKIVIANKGTLKEYISRDIVQENTRVPHALSLPLQQLIHRQIIPILLPLPSPLLPMLQHPPFEAENERMCASCRGRIPSVTRRVLQAQLVYALDVLASGRRSVRLQMGLREGNAQVLCVDVHACE